MLVRTKQTEALSYRECTASNR